MSWFQLDPDSVVHRTRADGLPPEIPCAGTSLQRGLIGFTILSVAGFAPWAILGRWFYRHTGEGGLYAFCALVFIGLSGPLLHRLILGPGSLRRFYQLFGVTFSAYAVLWIAGWMTLRGHPGSVAGLLAGTSAMGWMLTRAFGTRHVTTKVVLTLFLLNSLGYFAGGWLEGVVSARTGSSFLGFTLTRPTLVTLAQLLWGVCYGLGFGAGLGLAFHFCQAPVRARLAELRAEPNPASGSHA